MNPTIARPVALLLNVAHAVDHMFLLIFATAVAAIAADFGFSDWESLMPYGVGAFMLFGLGSLPAGRLGDLWGRRQMMLVFFFGMGASALLVALTQNAWQLAGALTLMGAFSSIYHPVGIPMLVRGTARPGLAIGVNGLAGNLGVALAAVTTGLLVKYAGWRAAFAVPALLSIGCGALFARVAPVELAPPSHDEQRTALAITEQVVLQIRIARNHPDVAEHFVQHARRPAGAALAAQLVEHFPHRGAEQADHDLAVGERRIVIRNFPQAGGHGRRRCGK